MIVNDQMKQQMLREILTYGGFDLPQQPGEFTASELLAAAHAAGRTDINKSKVKRELTQMIEEGLLEARQGHRYKVWYYRPVKDRSAGS